MDRAALDAWFAEADDVLTDWRPSGDAMVARVPESDDVEAMHGDSYYDQYDDSGTWTEVGWTAAGNPDPFGWFNETWRQYYDSILVNITAQMVAFGEAYFTIGEGSATPRGIITVPTERYRRPVVPTPAEQVREAICLEFPAAQREATEAWWPRRRGHEPACTVLDETHCLTPRARALQARHERNTGPVSRRGLDGFHR